jgi:transposase
MPNLKTILGSEHIATYYKLKSEGYPDREIADHLCVSHPTLDRWKRKYKITVKGCRTVC